MRIAMIGAKGIPASRALGGGIESHVECIATRLADLGHHVTVYVRPYTNPNREKRWNKVHLVTLPTIRSKYLEAIIHVFFSTIHVLFQRVDIIHYHGVGPSTLAWIPRIFKPRARVVVTFHSHDRLQNKWNALAKAYLAFGEWAACAFPHLTIAVSHGIQLYCRHMFDREVVYIPNGVDIPSGHPKTRFLEMYGLKSGEYFMSLGRLSPVKAHEDAIRAFAKIKTTKKLVIVGDATYDSQAYQEKLELLARDDDRVLFVGRRIDDELAELLAHCYCLIHPSHAEGLTFAILEAMSYARMVIMSDIPGNRELVDHSGIAYPVGKVDALAEVLQWVIRDPLLVQVRGERAREVVRRLYSWDRLIKKLEHEYTEL